VVTLFWQYINFFFPDALNYYYQDLSGPIRFAVSSLIIVFPIFIAVSWYLNNIYRRESQTRDSKIRKWLIYLTLFIASLVIIGDLVSVINTFLGGEITARFFLKALSILFVAVIIFWYYLDDVRRDEPSSMARYFALATGAIVLISIIGAFFIVGSPMTARLLQFDQERVSNLQDIQGQVVNYWQKKQMLPQQLSDLNDSISGYMVPIDPETKANYEYSVKDSATLSFELCATFDLSANAGTLKTAPVPVMYPGGISQNWDHSKGRVCFERTIDKQLYPPLTK
jgi:hypothetical protein